MNKQWTEEEIFILKTEYSQHTSRADIANKLKRTKTAINWKIHHLQLKRVHIYQKYLNIDIDYVCRLYKEGFSCSEISKEISSSITTVAEIIKNHNLTRSRSDCVRKYHFNEDFFKNIDSEEKAYFLGLLYADGTVGSKTNNIEITLQERDSAILDTFKKCINLEKSIYVQSKDSRIYHRLSITSSKFKHDLIKHGCIPNKTFKVTLPVIDKSLYRHFIRGCFDGDGCISIGKKSIMFNITGHIDLLSEIQNIMVNDVQLKHTNIQKAGNRSHTIYFCGKINCQKICKWLYTDANVFIQRKFDKFHMI